MCRLRVGQQGTSPEAEGSRQQIIGKRLGAGSKLRHSVIEPLTDECHFVF
jgi:hypothetical protein